MKKTTAILMIIAMLLSIMTFSVSAANAAGEDPTPLNIGIATTKTALNSQYDVSYVRQFVDGNGTPWLAGSGVGAHGGHETRIVRTPNGTYATYITNATGEPDDEHPNWHNGVATFDVIKITASGFESIYQDIYPQAAGSCTPNIMFDGEHTVYVTIIADDKDRYHETMGTGYFTNGIWLKVIEIDITSDTVTAPSTPSRFDHTTSPFSDHGYGYSQPILDAAHGKLYAITNGGEAAYPDAYPQGGYIAWWVYDLNTRTWDPTCHTIERFARRAYINGYPDGNGGFTMVIQRCSPSPKLGAALGCTFSTSGYCWDALYVMHVPDPNVDYAEDTTIWEATYVLGEKNNIANATHYGTGGCTYLDNQNRIHVIYSLSYYSPPTTKTKVTETRHAIYSLSGAQIYDQPISIKGPSGFAMTQGTNGYYHIFTLNGSSSGTKLEIWSSSDGISFTRRFSSTALVDRNGNNIAGGEKPIIANTRNGSVIDDTVALMFHTSGSGGDPYYYFSVQLPSDHKHSFTTVTTQPTCTERGYRTRTCTCGAVVVDSYKDALGHDYEVGTVTEPTEEAGGYTTYVCSRCQDSYVGDYTLPLPTLSASLCLKDSVEVRICVKNVSQEMLDAGYYAEYSTGGDFTRVDFDETTYKSDGVYKFPVDSFNANQLTQQITIRVCDGENTVKNITYSVKEYCDTVIGNSDDTDLVDLCKALMAYGYYAQQRFPKGMSEAISPSDYQTAIDAVGALSAEDIPEYTSSASYAAPVTGASASMSLESRTKISFYLKGVASAEGVAVTVDGAPWDGFDVEPVSSTKCRVTVNGLSSVDLVKQIVLTYGNTVIDYSPMAFVKYAAVHGTRDSDVCRALYLYVMAATEYFPEQNSGE